MISRKDRDGINDNKSTMLGNISIMEWNKTHVKHSHFTLPFDLELHLFPVNLMLLGHPKHFKRRANDEIKLTETEIINK